MTSEILNEMKANYKPRIEFACLNKNLLNYPPTLSPLGFNIFARLIAEAVQALDEHVHLDAIKAGRKATDYEKEDISWLRSNVVELQSWSKLVAVHTVRRGAGGRS